MAATVLSISAILTDLVMAIVQKNDFKKKISFHRFIHLIDPHWVSLSARHFYVLVTPKNKTKLLILIEFRV